MNSIFNVSKFFMLIFLICAFNWSEKLVVNVNTQVTRYVSSNGNDTNNNCSLPQYPCRTIQNAVNQSNSGDIIKVSEGDYRYNQDRDNCLFLRTRAVVCFVDKRLTIIGGYSKDNWFISNPLEYVTFIDGGGTYRGVAVIGYNTTTAHLEMKGFTIRNCKVEGPTYTNPYDPSGVGAGMLVQHASVNLSDVIFDNNRAFGANTTSGSGGQADGSGLRIEEPPQGTTSILQRVIFENNQSVGGNGPDRGGIAFGALYIYKASVVIEDSEFRNNIAQAGNSLNGSGIYGNLRADGIGGGISVMEGNVTLRKVVVRDNQARGGDGKTYGGGGYGGGIFIENFDKNKTTSVQIVESIIENNQAIAGNGTIGGNGAGGGIDVDSSNITIDRSKIISNKVFGGNGSISAGPGAGGGVYIFTVRSGELKADLRNVIIANNVADQGSGNISVGNGGGGGVVIHGVEATITHATIYNNQIGNSLVLGQGLLVQPWPDPNNPQYPANVRLINSVIANHSGNPLAAAIVVQKNSSLIFESGLFSSNLRDTNDDGQPVPKGTISGLSSMISSPVVGFVAPQSPYYNFRLRLDAIAKDKSSNIIISHDYDDQYRPHGELSDYGADEYHPFDLVFVSGDGIITVDWTKSVQLFEGGVSRYGILVNCGADANSPIEVQCGEEVDIGISTKLTLSGLTNFKTYSILINAYDSEGKKLATSIPIQAFPSDILVFLPVINK